MKREIVPRLEPRRSAAASPAAQHRAAAPIEAPNSALDNGKVTEVAPEFAPASPAGTACSTWAPHGAWTATGTKSGCMNDGGAGLASGPGLRAETEQSIGRLAYCNHVWGDDWTSTIGVSRHIQDNIAGQPATAFSRGSCGSLDLL